jgi:hypothetical protein
MENEPMSPEAKDWAFLPRSSRRQFRRRAAPRHPGPRWKPGRNPTKHALNDMFQTQTAESSASEKLLPHEHPRLEARRTLVRHRPYFSTREKWPGAP